MEFDKKQAYKSLLEDLKIQKSEIDVQLSIIIEQLRKMGEVDLSDPIPSKSSEKDFSVTRLGNTEINHDTFHGLSVGEAAKKYLDKVGSPARSTKEIFNNLVKGGLSTTERSLYVTLTNAAIKGDKGIEKVSGGNWGLTHWYKKDQQTQ